MNSALFKDRLAQLVATPSVSSTHKDYDMSNAGVCHLLAGWLEALGFTCELQPIPGCPGKVNLLAVRGKGPEGLVLAGHTDTVPCNPERWQQDPFTLTERDNKFYGLGATDMKGFFPTVLAALEAVRDQPLQQPIIILATADEESTMSGARLLAAQGRPKARYAVIGEPTAMRPIRMHKGIMMDSVRITGQAGHSSNPGLGKNALEAMHSVLGDLLAYRAHLQSRYQNPGFDVAVPTLNLGCIHGGDNPNRICGQCELHFDLRPLPGMSLAELRADIGLRLDRVADKFQVQMEYQPLFPGIEPFEQAHHSQLVRLAETLTGFSASSVAFATEAPFLQSLNMQTIVMGPGSINQAHQPDEFIEQAQIAPAVDVLVKLIGELCVNPGPQRGTPASH